MRAEELRKLPLDELEQKLEDLLDEMANLRIQKATHQLVDPTRLKTVRRDIARYRTLLKEYELGISKPNLEN